MSSKAIVLSVLCIMSIGLTGCVVTDADLKEEDGGSGPAAVALEITPLPLISSINSDDEQLADPNLLLINSKEELDKLGSEALSANDQIDFETESVIVFMLGEQPDGAWCRILGVTKEGDDITVLAQVNRSSVPATSTLFPFAMATVKKTSGNLVLDAQNLEDQPEP